MNEQLNYIFSMLSCNVAAALFELLEKYPDPNEIRLRSGKHLSICYMGKNISSHYTVSSEEIQYTVNVLCHGSMHSFMDTIKKGYISAGNGIRVGICGRAIIENNVIECVSEILSLNIRIPVHVFNVSGKVWERIENSDFSVSMLLYSQPGVGKTTVLRDIARRLCLAGRRVCLVDEREELSCAEFDSLDNLDLFLGYPKDMAIEIATRTMSPEYILCDEIGSEDEAWALLGVQNAGVPIIATAHAGSVGGLLRRSGIELLHDASAFDLYVGIKRDMSTNKITYTFCSRKELA